MPERILFISYSHTPNTASGYASKFGFGSFEVSVDFPIRNRDDLLRALTKGLAENGITGRRIVILNWRFFEE